MSAGTLHMILASLVFSVAYSFIKVLTRDLGFWETAFLRGTLGFLILSVWLVRIREPILGHRANLIPLAARGLFGGVAMILYFWALQLTTLANASSLHYAHPLFTTFLAVPILGERLNARKVMLVFAALGGVLLIVQPTPALVRMGSLPALASALFASAAYVSIRFVSSREHPAVIINALSFCTMLLAAPMALATWTAPTGRLWAFVAAAGVLTTVAQYFMTMAYKLEQASTVSAFSFSSILWSLMIGALVFGEIPERLEAFGIFILFGSLVALVLVRAREAHPNRRREADLVPKEL
jgi:drug/metabolite transporter (DMT)-like permease